MDFCPNNKWLLSGSFDGTVIVTNCDRRSNSHVFTNHANKVLQVQWHPSLPLFASCSADKSVAIWKREDVI